MNNDGWNRKNIIREKSFGFALKIANLYRALKVERKFVLSKQLLRSGTSIGANVEEADVAQSRRDFISKMSIALKETRESRYWLRLMKEARWIDRPLDPYLKDAEELERILTAILKTCRSRSNKAVQGVV